MAIRIAAAWDGGPEFWSVELRHIDNGMVADGRHRILREVATDFRRESGEAEAAPRGTPPAQEPGPAGHNHARAGAAGGRIREHELFVLVDAFVRMDFVNSPADLRHWLVSVRDLVGRALPSFEPQQQLKTSLLTLFRLAGNRPDPTVFDAIIEAARFYGGQDQDLDHALALLTDFRGRWDGAPGS